MSVKKNVGRPIVKPAVLLIFFFLSILTGGCVSGGSSTGVGKVQSMNRPVGIDVKEGETHAAVSPVTQGESSPTEHELFETEISEKESERSASGKKTDGSASEILFPDAGFSGLTENKTVEPVVPDTFSEKTTFRRTASTDIRSFKPRVPAPKEDRVQVELAFDNADLFEVLDATLYELFKINYIIDPHVKAKVSFHFSGNYTQAEFINQLNSVLQLSNLSITRGPGTLYKVVKKSDSTVYSGQDVSETIPAGAAGDISRMIRLRYIDAATASKTIRSFASRGANVVIDRVNNALIITDTLDNIDRIVQVLSLMDVEYFSDVAWRIFPVKEVDAGEISADISNIVKATGLYKRIGAVRGGYHILPLKTMNAILVATVWPSIFDLVEKWIAAMDHADNSGTGVFVYFVENGNALELSEILKQLYSEKKSSSDKTQIVKPIAVKDKAKPENNRAVNPPTGLMSGELSGDIEIIPDETNNAIIFKASQRDYKVIRKVLGELDVMPRQVLINVVVVEVTLTHKTQYGVQWMLNNSIGKYKGQGIFDIKGNTQALNRALGTVSEFSYGIYNSADVLKGLITALGTDGDLNILSSPNIMAVDNQEAYIEVGEDVPTISGTVTQTDGVVNKTVQYRNTGVILKVTPHINSSGLVKMELSQEVSSRGVRDEELKTDSILTRKAETSLVVHDNQTILMGGMMSQNQNNSDAGVPFLKDIPLLGYLFKSETRDGKKTELIFLLTPHVIDSRNEADNITREFSRNIESIKNLIKKEEE